MKVLEAFPVKVSVTPTKQTIELLQRRKIKPAPRPYVKKKA